MINWTEDMIREEMKRLDEQTGLNGSSLPICFNYRAATLGRFVTDGHGMPKRFEFSLHFFHGNRFTRQEALDVIRHEYAHYMDCMLYPDSQTPHGPTWKRCCQQVGARPMPYYTEDFARISRWFDAQETASRTRSTFSVGQKLLHETFGVGIIKAITPAGSTQLLTVDFGGTVKTVEAGWAEKNCAY